MTLEQTPAHSTKSPESYICTGNALPLRGVPNDAPSGENQLLDEGCYWGKRERERERDVSALLTHLPTGPNGHAAIPGTSVPN